jgi:hypothetical protein
VVERTDVWEIDGVVPDWALLYSASNETGKELVDIGRGTTRGADVSVAGATPTALRGWEWGTQDTVQRWGTNVVSGITAGGTGLGDLVRAAFDRARAEAGYDECSLSIGDSGGAVFIKDANNIWRLAGINYGTDGYFSYVNDVNSAFNAVIFDEGGLWVGDSNPMTLITDTPADKPSSFYATRIYSNLAWINNIILESNPELHIVKVPAGLMVYWTGRGGHTYQVYTSTDLLNWGSPVSTQAPPYDAPLRYTDTGSLTDKVFYRVLDTF